MNFRNKNILLICHHGILGGAERQCLGLSKILTDDYNCDVNLLLTHNGEVSNDFRNYANDCKVNNIIYLGESYLLLKEEFSYRNLKRLYWSLKYLLRLRNGLLPYHSDFIIPFLNFPSKVSFYLYYLLPSVKFTFWHQLGLDSTSDDIFEKIAIRHTQCFIANAENGLDLFKLKYKIDNSKLHILPQYVSLNYMPKDRNKLLCDFDLPKEAIVIGMVAHYRPEKLHFFLLETFKILENEYSNVFLVFLGNKDNTKVTFENYLNLKEVAKKYKIENKVRILSNKKIEDILNILDIGILVSDIEGVPNTVMEYMEYGLPVVATAHPGCKDLLGHSEFLIQNNEKELYSSIKKLITSSNLRKVEGAKNKNIIKKFNKNTYMDQLTKIFNQHLT